MSYNALNSLQNLITSATFGSGFNNQLGNGKLSIGTSSENGARNATQEDGSVEPRACLVPPILRCSEHPQLNKRATYKYSSFSKASKPKSVLSNSRKRKPTEAVNIDREKARQTCDNEDLNTEPRCKIVKSKCSSNKNKGSEKLPETYLCRSQITHTSANTTIARGPDFTEIMKRACLMKQSSYQTPANKFNSADTSSVKSSLPKSDVCQTKKDANSRENERFVDKTSELVSVRKNYKIASEQNQCARASPDLIKVVPDLSKIARFSRSKEELVDSYSDFVSNIQFVPYVRKTQEEADQLHLNDAERSFETLNESALSYNPEHSRVPQAESGGFHAESYLKQKSNTGLNSRFQVDDSSSSRILPLSDQALTQAHLLGLSLNKPSTNSKSSYAVDFKLSVVEWLIENNMNTCSTAEKFQINRKQVYSWYKDREKLKSWATKTIKKGTNNKGPSRRLVNKCEWSRYKQLDDRIFNRCVVVNDLITVNNQVLRSVAAEEASVLGYKEFKASYNWLSLWKERIKKRHNLKVVIKNRQIIQWQKPP